jgi:HEAT repeat protein
MHKSLRKSFFIFYINIAIVLFLLLALQLPALFVNKRNNVYIVHKETWQIGLRKTPFTFVIRTFHQKIIDRDYLNVTFYSGYVSYYFRTQPPIKTIISGLQSHEFKLQIQALWCLLDNPNPAAESELLKLLKSKDITTQSITAQILWKLGNQKGKEVMMQQANSTDVFTAASARDALELMDNLSPLRNYVLTISLLLGKNEYLVSNMIKDHFGFTSNKLGFTTDKIHGLEKDLFSYDTHKIIKAAWVLGFSGIKLDKIEPRLVELAKDNNEYVRQAALSALARIKSEKALNLLYTASSSDFSSWVRFTAVCAIGHIHDSKSIPVLTKIAATESDILVKNTCLLVVKQLSTDKSTEAKLFSKEK